MVRVTVENTPEQVWKAWIAADRAGDVDAAGHCALTYIKLLPTSFEAWFQAGLFSKAVHDWAESAARNLRALELFSDSDRTRYDGVNPAAWNLGIAATAIGDWATVRRAWQAYGITAVDDGNKPIDIDFGNVPIRLNPNRPSLPHQLLVDHGAQRSCGAGAAARPTRSSPTSPPQIPATVSATYSFMTESPKVLAACATEMSQSLTNST